MPLENWTSQLGAQHFKLSSTQKKLLEELLPIGRELIGLIFAMEAQDEAARSVEASVNHDHIKAAAYAHRSQAFTEALGILEQRTKD